MLYDIAIVGGGPAGCSAAVIGGQPVSGHFAAGYRRFWPGSAEKPSGEKLSGAAGPVRSGTDGCLYRSYEGRRDHGGPP